MGDRARSLGPTPVLLTTGVAEPVLIESYSSALGGASIDLNPRDLCALRAYFSRFPGGSPIWLVPHTRVVST